MESTDRSLLAADITSLTGEATSRKRKQSRGGDDSVSPARRYSRLRYQESGSCSSMLTTLADATQEEAQVFRRLYLGDDSSAACESGNDPLPRGGVPPALHSVPSGDTSRGGSVLAGEALAEGRMYDQFKPFVSKSPSPGHSLGDGPAAASMAAAAAAIDVQGCLPGDAPKDSFTTSWQRHEWNNKKQDTRLRGGFEPGSESVGGRSTGTGASGVTKQNDSAGGSGSGVFRQGNSRDQFLREFEGKRRISQEWNSKRTASGSGSAVTKDRGVWGSSAEGGKLEAEDDGDAQSEEHQQSAASPEQSPPLDTFRRAAAKENFPVMPVASTIPLMLREKRGRREFDEGGDEREVKSVRVEGVKINPRRMALSASVGGSGSLSPDSVLVVPRDVSPPGRGSATPSAVSKQADEVPETSGQPGTRPAAECAGRQSRGCGGVEERVGETSVGQAGTSPAGGEMRMREHSPSHTGTRERLSDSHADLADVESSGRLSGYDQEISVSDAQDSDGNLFILSSGRTRRPRQGGSGAPRQPTIDDEFEQYFSQMLL